MATPLLDFSKPGSVDLFQKSLGTGNAGFAVASNVGMFGNKDVPTNLKGKRYDQMTSAEKAQFDEWFNSPAMKMSLGESERSNILKSMRPEYKRDKAYDENIALARTNLSAPDREAQLARTDIDESTADAIGRAREFAGSTSSLLDTLATLNTGRNKAFRGLASDQAAIRQQKLATLMGSNVALAEENDKAWNYNQNQPYQMNMKQEVEYQKYLKENKSNILDMIGGIASSFIPGLGNILGKGGKGSANVRASYDVAGDNGY